MFIIELQKYLIGVEDACFIFFIRKNKISGTIKIQKIIVFTKLCKT